MKVGVIQSCYVPWRGYFDFISAVDLFVFYDDLQFSKGSWRNRNRIKTRHGLQWLTVPIRHLHLEQRIDETAIDQNRNWGQEHLNLLDENYSKSPYYRTYRSDLEARIFHPWSSISALNIELCRWIMGCLEIRTPILLSSTLGLEGSKTDRLLQLLNKVGAKAYLSGPSAAAYLEVARFQEEGIHLEYKSYDYPPYPQLWGAFNGQVTVLDLLFNVGPEAVQYLRSRTPNLSPNPPEWGGSVR